MSTTEAGQATNGAGPVRIITETRNQKPKNSTVCTTGWPTYQRKSMGRIARRNRTRILVLHQPAPLERFSHYLRRERNSADWEESPQLNWRVSRVREIEEETKWLLHTEEKQALRKIPVPEKETNTRRDRDSLRRSFARESQPNANSGRLAKSESLSTSSRQRTTER